MLAAGQLVGNYRIVSMIGSGGMGAVYLAEHPLIGKRVAFKVIHRELATHDEIIGRFFQEAKAVSGIADEHVVEVHDFGMTPEGDHFYIMEYLSGESVAAVLAREVAIDVTRAIHIAAQVAAALDAAHRMGVLHRDLKPDNVMLIERHGDPDFVKVLDFGLAKMFAAAGSSVHTARGVLLGTPQYMSPEACDTRRPLDARADVYSLGILMFHMMTGVLPFDGASLGEVMIKQVEVLPPAPRGLNPHIPPSIEQIVLRCLAKRPEARFGSMAELRAALRDPEGYLRSAPPIVPARSVAPGDAGVDAKQVVAYATAAAAAAAKRKTKGRTAQVRAVIEGVAIPPVQKTMEMAPPPGYAVSPPGPRPRRRRRAWPWVLAAGVAIGLAGGYGVVHLLTRGASVGAAAGSAARP